MDESTMFSSSKAIKVRINLCENLQNFLAKIMKPIKTIPKFSSRIGKTLRGLISAIPSQALSFC